MHENIMEFIFEIFFMSLIILTISLFIVINQNVNKSIEVVKADTINERIIYEGAGNPSEVVNGATIISTIQHGLKHDIEVDGYQILKEEIFLNMDFNFIVLDSAYRISYEFNDKGNIILVHYELI